MNDLRNLHNSLLGTSLDDELHLVHQRIRDAAGYGARRVIITTRYVDAENLANAVAKTGFVCSEPVKVVPTLDNGLLDPDVSPTKQKFHYFTVSW